MIFFCFVIWLFLCYLAVGVILVYQTSHMFAHLCLIHTSWVSLEWIFYNRCRIIYFGHTGILVHHVQRAECFDPVGPHWSCIISWVLPVVTDAGVSADGLRSSLSPQSAATCPSPVLCLYICLCLLWMLGLFDSSRAVLCCPECRVTQGSIEQIWTCELCQARAI